jgi:hypothetical protein
MGGTILTRSKAMKVYIPTLGRPQHQHTFSALICVRSADVVLVVAPEERAEYKKFNPDANIIATPKGVQGHIGRVREWIIAKHMVTSDDPRLVMMDDDLVFSRRRVDDPTKATAATVNDLQLMLKCLEGTLKSVAHAGIIAREGANRYADDGALECTRMMRVLGYNTAKLPHDIAFGRVQFMEDFDVTLQLLRAGLRNVVHCEWWHNQGGSNLPGGCATSRTMEAHAAAAHALRALHPDFVKVVQKQTKTAWGGGERTDVKIAWKKAYQSSGRK